MTTRHERMVLRACPCHAPAGDRSAACERVASVRATLHAKHTGGPK